METGGNQSSGMIRIGSFHPNHPALVRTVVRPADNIRSTLLINTALGWRAGPGAKPARAHPNQWARLAGLEANRVGRVEPVVGKPAARGRRFIQDSLEPRD